MTRPLLETLHRKARAARRRQRGNDALGAAAWWIPLPLLAWTSYLALSRVIVLPSGVSMGCRVAIGAAFGVALASVARELLRRRPIVSASLALDRYHALSDRTTNALTFSILPVEKRTYLMERAIADAEGFADGLRPSRAVPWQVPRRLFFSVLLGGAIFGLNAFHASAPLPEQTVPAASQVTPFELTTDDIELLRDQAQTALSTATDPDTLATAKQLNELIEAVAERRLDRQDVLRELERMSQQLAQDVELEREALDEGLDGLAEKLEQSTLSKPVAGELGKQQLNRASAELRELAKKLREQRPKDPRQLEALRKALEQASATNRERIERIELERERLEAEKRRLLAKKSDGKAAPSDAEPLRQAERQLKRLERNRRKANSAAQQLSELDRDLARAASELARDLEQAGSSLEDGAEDLEEIAQQELTDKEKAELKRQIEELRDLLRQQNAGGAEQQERLREFARRARGKRPGQASSGESGKPGSGRAGEPGGAIALGRSGRQLAVPSAAGAAEPSESGNSEANRRGSEPGSSEGSDPKGEANLLQGETQNVTAQAIDSGAGPSSSEVVFGAAERGFRGKGYRNLYREYRTVAERVIAQDDIPPGHRFYVRRYFQLIRPRD